MRRLIGFGSAVAFASFGLVAACSGSSVPESMVNGGGTTASGGSDGAGGLHLTGGSGAAGSSALGGLSSGGDGNGSGSGSGGACAASTAQAELAPVYLVFLLDESGSMGDGQYGDRTKKWDPVTSALNAFFADPESAGIMASLGVFPLNKNMTKGPATSDISADCTADVYGTPIVPPRALPDDKTFAAAITTLDPPNEYGTPTYAGLSGTITYAETLVKEDASRKVAIVMVTDGTPEVCKGDNTVANTAMAAKAVADHIQTYVIGVGDNLTSLNDIAKGGGTDKAFIVSLMNPEQTRTDLLGAINLIRGKSISCELPIPTPPVGMKLDPQKVDVKFTASGMAPTSLPYGADCTGDAAWHYDSVAMPTQIMLCDSTCAAVKADPKGKLDVEFGCKIRQVVQ